MRIILHIDLDAFFAACEERENPSLKGKPVIIGADPKGGEGRGVVSTANYEARKYGVHSAMPISIAYRKCQHAIFLRPNFELYENVSAHLMEIFRKFGKVEVGGLDEAFIEPDVKNYEEAEKLAVKIKAEVLRKEKLTCSIGIAPNKLIAKVASDFQKPKGLTTVKPKEIQEFLRPLKVRKLLGIGPKTEQKLKEIFSIETVAQLEKISRTALVEEFGNSYGNYLYEAARGIDETPLIEKWEPKSFAREFTFERDTADKKELEETLEELCKDVHKRVLENNYKFRTVTIVVRYSNFEQHTSAKSIKEPTDILQVILDLSKLLLQKYLAARKIRKIGVRVSGFIKTSS